MFATDTTGQAIAPLSGTYKGSLSDGNLWTVQMMSNSSFDINATGTLWLSDHNDVIGATMTASGMATNANGTQQSQPFGNFVPDASQVSVVITIGQTLALGTLMKQ